MIRALACASLLVCAGCLALGDIPLDQCGNHVVEDNEDCDLPDPDTPDTIDTCDECTWRCVPPSTSGTCADDWRYEPGRGTCCPVGYACGDDNLCHAPSGLFREAIAGRDLPVDRVALAELDGDNSLELVGLSDDAVDVIALAFDGTIDAEQNAPVGGVVRWAAGNLEGPADTTTELVGVFGEGMVAFGAPAGKLEAFPFTTFIIPDPQIHTDRKSRVGLVPSTVDPAPLIIAARTDDSCTTGDNVCAMIVTAEPVGVQPPVLPCGLGRFADAGAVIGDRIASRAVTPTESLFALGLRDGTGSVACVYPVHLDETLGASPTMGTQMLLDLPPGAELANEHGDFVFARLTGDPCPSLLVPLELPGAATQVGIARGRSTAPCSIDPTVELVAGSEWVLPLAAGQLDGAGGDELVGDWAVGAIAASGAPASYDFTFFWALPRFWHSAALGDLNRDGLVDIVGAGVSDQFQDGDDVDVLRQRPAAEGGGFVTSKILTADPVALVRTSDMDGDLYDDVVFAQNDAIDVAFGAPAGGPPVIVRASTFEQVNDVLEHPIGFSTDGIDDIIVATPRGGTLLFGSFTRQLVAPLLFGDPDDPRFVADVAIGDVDGVNGDDLVALVESSLAPGIVLALATPTRGFFGPPGDPIPAPGLEDILYTGGVFVAVTYLDPGSVERTALLAISDGFQPPARVRAFAANEDGPGWSFMLLGSIDLAGQVESYPNVIEEVHVTDADRNGSPELLIDFAHRGTNGGRTTWVVGMSFAETAVSFTANELLGGSGACTTSAAIDMDRLREGDELIAACPGGVESLITGGMIAGNTAVDQLVAGDLTGDGVDDLVVLSEPDNLHGQLTVLVQCTTRDPRPCEPPAGGMK